MGREVVISPEAEADLFELYNYIAKRSGRARAIGYVGRIETYCLGSHMPENAAQGVTISGQACASSVLSGA